MPNVLDHIIRISGDNRRLKATLKDSDSLLKGSSRLTQNYAKVLQGALETANKKLSEVSKNLKSIEDIKVFKEQANQVRNLRNELEQINKTQRMPTPGGGGPSGGMGMMGLLRNIPGLGGLLTLGGAFGFATAAYRQRAQTAGVGLRLQALGAGGMRRRNLELGFGTQENLEQRLGLVQAIGGGRGLEDIQALSRVTGVDAQQLIGAAGARRRIGLGQAESLQAVRRSMSILSSTIGDTLDRGRIGEYLSSMDNSLTMLGTGIKIDETSFGKAFGTLLRNEFFRSNPERAGQALRGIDEAFRTSTGAQFGFMSQIMANAMQKAGMNVNPLSLMFQTRRGIFAQGGPGAANIFESIREKFGQLGFGGMAGRSQMGRGLMIKELFGIQNVDLATEIGNAIATKQFRKAKELTKEYKSPEEIQSNALDIMKNTDGNIVKVQATLNSILDELGDNIAISLKAIAEAVTFGKFETSANKTERLAGMLTNQSFSAAQLPKEDLLMMSRVGGLGARGDMTDEKRRRIRENLETEKRQLMGDISLTSDKEEKENLRRTLDLLIDAIRNFSEDKKPIIVNVSNSRGKSVNTTNIGKAHQ